MKKNFFFGSKEVFLVAEIGNNHEGSFKNAIKLIDKAAEAKVDAVKFQTYKTDLFLSNDISEERQRQLKNFELSYKDFEKIANYAKKKGLIFFSTPLDLESANFLNKLQPLFKIASSDNNFIQLIDRIVSFQKPLIISTGIIRYKDVMRLYNYIVGKKFSSKLAFLHCVSAYPAKMTDLNLGSIQFLKSKFKDCYIGYSDHSIGIDACIYASLLGANIIEKHFTLDHKFSKFKDHSISANPQELKEMVKKIRKVKKIIGQNLKIISKEEKKNIVAMRRSMTFSRDLDKGHTINEEDIIMCRPGTGQDYTKIKKFLSKKLKNPVKKGDLIK